MLSNAFIDKPEEPDDEELTAELGPARAVWDKLLNDLAEEYDVTVREWHSYSRKAGWSLRLKRKKRNILYLSPFRGSFGVMFILGDRAVQAARQSGLSRTVMKIIDESPKYPEGTGVRLEVKTLRDIPGIRKLTRIKLDN